MSVISKIIDQIDIEDFKIPIIQNEKDYFPDLLESHFTSYINLYEKKFLPVVDEGLNFSSKNKDVIISKIKSLCSSIIKSIEYFYSGEILKATQEFNEGLDKIFFKDLADINFVTNIPEKTKFYRARKNENKRLNRADLFHINFESRHIVSTNRYSIPGFPALYLGDSTYICWEEFDQPELKTLNFSLFQNTRPLKIIQLQRIEDLLTQLTKDNNEQIPILLTYFTFFPLTIACSIKVKHSLGNFKPEYIIPQLLLQYISDNKDFDGLKFPSSKVDYSKLHQMSTYNFVFPVRVIKKDGFCEQLCETFYCTQPTSLNLEEIVRNPVGSTFGMSAPADERRIELIEDIQSPYSGTSFGKLEYYLSGREIKKI